VKTLTEAEAERFIVELLEARGPMTTHEIALATMDEAVRCPDAPVRFLTKLRVSGVILGKVDASKGTWIWSLPGEGD
jgi:hypothetical protein